jgi:hypothetical protein
MGRLAGTITPGSGSVRAWPYAVPGTSEEKKKTADKMMLPIRLAISLLKIVKPGFTTLNTRPQKT